MGHSECPLSSQSGSCQCSAGAAETYRGGRDSQGREEEGGGEEEGGEEEGGGGDKEGREWKKKYSQGREGGEGKR